MKTIVPATVHHVDYIAKSLVQIYTNLNNEMGVEIYKTDYDLFLRITESRIRSNELGFSYFVLQNDDVNVGFVITLFQKNKGEVLMIETQDTDDVEQILHFSIAHLKNQGAEYVSFEATKHQPIYQHHLESLWAKAFSTKFVIQ